MTSCVYYMPTVSLSCCVITGGRLVINCTSTRSALARGLHEVRKVKDYAFTPRIAVDAYTKSELRSNSYSWTNGKSVMIE